jgi:hypothetical protein
MRSRRDAASLVTGTFANAASASWRGEARAPRVHVFSS